MVQKKGFAVFLRVFVCRHVNGSKKVCSEGLQRPCKNTKPLVGSDPQIFWHFSAKYLKDHSHQAKTEKNTTVISSNPQIHAAFWNELFEGLQRPVQERQTTGRQWSYFGISVPNIWRITATRQEPKKKEHDSDQQQSPNSCRFLAWAIWRIYTTVQEQPTKTLVGSDRQIFGHFSAKYFQDYYCHQGKRAEKTSSLMRSDFRKLTAITALPEPTKSKWSAMIIKHLALSKTKYLKDQSHHSGPLRL